VDPFFTRLRVLGYSKKIAFGGLSAYASGVTSAEASLFCEAKWRAKADKKRRPFPAKGSLA